MISRPTADREFATYLQEGKSLPVVCEVERRGKREDVLAPVLEGALLLAVGLIGLLFREPLLFASLGPTAYEMVEKPELPSSRAYNVFVGHTLGLGAGFIAVAVLRIWHEPSVLANGVMTAPRVWACVIGAALTVLFTLALHAGQPAALATTLLVCLGTFRTLHDAVIVLIAVAILTAIGTPIRRLREKKRIERLSRKITETEAQRAA